MFKMTKMRTMIWSRRKLLSRKQGRYREENLNDLRNTSNYVNEEYLEAIRTKSFVEMYSKVQGQLMARKSLDRPSTSSPVTRHLHLSNIVEPSQEVLTDIVEASELHHFLSCFFQMSFDACKLCQLILKSIHQTRVDYSAIGRVTEQFETISSDDKDYAYDQCNKIYGSLAAFSSLTSPLSNIINPAQFQELRDNLYLSLDIFTSRCRKIRRRRKLLRCCKRMAGGACIAVYSALAITLIVLAIHSVVGLMAAPGLIVPSVALFSKKHKRTKQMQKTMPLERLEAQLDAAARGVYLLINDFDTMSRLLMRLNNEIQHSKFVAGLCLGRRTNEMLKEVVRELQINQTGLMNQLQDLEEHVYLCIVNINRSRRLVVEKMVADLGKGKSSR